MATQLSKSVQKAVATARLHLRTGNPGAYARAMSAEHRCASLRQQLAIWAEIRADEMEHHFGRIHNGTCVIAIEPAVQDEELALVEYAA